MKPQKLNKLQLCIIMYKIKKDKHKQYKYITDFSKTNNRECLKFDMYNEYLYNKNVDYYNKCSDYLKNNSANFSIDTKPLPPRKITNVQAFKTYKKRSVQTKNIEQTLSTLYLINKGYTLIMNDNNMVIDPSLLIDNKQFESYMAIELVMNITNSSNELHLIDNCIKELKIKNIDSIAKYKINKTNNNTSHYKNIKNKSNSSLTNTESINNTYINPGNLHSSYKQHLPNVKNNINIQQPPKYSKINNNILNPHTHIHTHLNHHPLNTTLPHPLPLPLNPLPILKKNNYNNTNIVNYSSNPNNINSPQPSAPLL